MTLALERAKADGGKIMAAAGAGRPLSRRLSPLPAHHAIVEGCPGIPRSSARRPSPPILYAMKYGSSPRPSSCTTPCRRALASFIVSTYVSETETFLSALCFGTAAIANVNLPPKGPRSPRGRRSAGPSAARRKRLWARIRLRRWEGLYSERRRPTTINYSPGPALAQGIKFEI